MRFLFSKSDAKDIALVGSSQLFDLEFYSALTGVRNRSRAVKHYVRGGWRTFNPSVYFDNKWYLDKNEDVKKANVCPLVHFLRYGHLENRSASPFFDIDQMRSSALSNSGNHHPIFAYLESTDWFRKNAVRLFDRDYYRAGAAKNGVTIDGEPFRHYMMKGWRHNLDPHPLFSTSYYLTTQPDVHRAGINPLYHYVTTGGAELRQPHPRFDPEYYTKQIADWDGGFCRIPLLHFLVTGVKMGLSPARDFDVNYYIQKYPDVRRDGINPFVHFILHGETEGRTPLPARKASTYRDAAMQGGALGELAGYLPPLSVVIPTYNRRLVLQATLEQCFTLPKSETLQFIIVNDGSTDDTAAYLDKLSSSAHNVDVIQRQNGGPASARNEGAAIAKHDVILFMGDDIRPTGPDFFAAHQDFHQKRASSSDAMVGKVVWPSGATMPITPVMRRIQGRGGEQFGFADLTPYTWLDWRFFYTSNISLKKDAVQDWLSQGFSDDFKLYGFEDIEFAFRLDKSEAGLQIFYDPLSEGEHIHPYKFEQFVNRQLNTGRMARTFLDLHPTAGEALGLRQLIEALSLDNRELQKDAADILSVFEGVKGWVSYLERHEFLGNSGFHDDLLGAFFEFAFAVGFINAARSPSENLGAALTLAFNEFLTRMRRALRHEVTVHDHIFPMMS